MRCKWEEMEWVDAQTGSDSMCSKCLSGQRVPAACSSFRLCLCSF